MRLLAAAGPITAAVLARELSVGEPEVERELQARPDVVETVVGWRSVWPLVEGAVLTHLVEEQELELDVLTADGDLDLWARLADEGLPLTGGGEVRTRWYGEPDEVPDGATTALVGPPGWLAGCAADQVVGLRLVRGTLSVEPYDELPAPPAAAVTALVTAAMIAADAALDVEEEELPGAEIDDVVLEALMRDGAVLTEPIPPLSALFSLAGLEVSRGLIGLPGTDWDGTAGPSPLGHDQRRRVARLRAVLAMVGRPGTDPADDIAPLGNVAILLAGDDDVLAAVGADVAAEPSRRSAVESLAAAVTRVGVGVGRDAAAAAYLQAVAADSAAEPDRAQHYLDAALAAAPDLRPALDLAGHYAAERGDAFTADRLFRAAGHDASWPWRRLLREFLKAPDGPVGRNKPCPCGSGRKHKLCCGAQAPHPLPRRALWRYRRALAFALGPAHRLLSRQLARELAGPLGDLEQALVDPLVPDLALVEGGLLIDYLEQRGALMPADEVGLIHRWLDTPLALLEVLATRPGREVTLRALPDGEPIVVPDRALSGDVHRLDLLLGRLLDDGQGPVFMASPRLVPRERRGQLVALLAQEEVDPYDVVGALAPRALPQLATREGEELVLCTARYAVADLDQVWTALADELEGEEDDLVEVADVDGDQILRGRLQRVGDGLQIETNALERLRRLQQLVLRVAPAARLVSESSVPAAELMAGHGADGAPSAPAAPAPAAGPCRGPGGLRRAGRAALARGQDPGPRRADAAAGS